MNLSRRLVSAIFVKCETEQTGRTKADYSQDRWAGTPGQKCSVVVCCNFRHKQTSFVPLGVHLAVTELGQNTTSLKVGDELDSSADLSGLISVQDCVCSWGYTSLVRDSSYCD